MKEPQRPFLKRLSLPVLAFRTLTNSSIYLRNFMERTDVRAGKFRLKSGIRVLYLGYVVYEGPG